MIHPLTNNKKFAIYARLSREDETESDYSSSIENQIAILEQKLLELNLEVVDIYVDDGYSGKNLDRPAFNRLIDDIYKKKIDGIIVKDLSRIGRNLIEVGRFVEELCPNHLIRIISVLDGYDSAYNEDDDSIVLRSFVNDYYLKECSAKIRKGLENIRDKELFIRFGRYGYDVVDGKLKINETEAEIIRWIFKQYAKGIPTGQIVKTLIKNKIYGIGYLRYLKTGKPCLNEEPYYWSFRSINRIIHDNTYIGEFTNCSSAKYTEKYTFPNAHEPIISKELFYQAQEICGSRKIIPNKDFNNFLYDGIHNRYYYFRKGSRVKKGYYKSGEIRYSNLSSYFYSTGFNLNYDDTMKIILNETQEVLNELKRNRNYILEILLNMKSDIKPKIAKIKEDIFKFEQKKKNATTKYISGKISKENFQIEKISIEKEIIKLSSELKELENKISYENMTAYNNYIDGILSIDTVDIKLARLIFSRIVVTKDSNSNPVFEFEYNIKS